MLVTMKELLEEAEANNRAVGSFTIPNMEIAMGTLKAAEETGTSVILQIAEGRLKYTPLDMIGPLMVQAAKDAAVKVCVHLDHGLTLETVKEALSYGFTSVMFDGSRYEFDENIQRTNEAAQIARKAGASVEAELGTIGGREATDKDESSCYTNVEQFKEFIKRTDLDAIAPAIGNAHGHYKGEPKLNFERLKELQNASHLPMVLHGGSGLSDQDFRRCINFGIRKINIATANLDALVQGARDYLAGNGEHNYYDLNTHEVANVYQNVLHCIRVFNNQEAI